MIALGNIGRLANGLSAAGAAAGAFAPALSSAGAYAAAFGGAGNAAMNGFDALFSQSSGSYLGGSYRNVRAGNQGGQVHHVPAYDALQQAYGEGTISFEDAPGILMDSADHIRTTSWGSGDEAVAWRELQAELIEQGRLHNAIEMDINDVTTRFESKYNDAITQYLNNLPADLRSRINVTLPI